MDPHPPPASSNGSVYVPKKSSSTFMNTFFWYLFQTLTVSSMLLMLLSIYWMTFASGNINIRDVCVITVAFAIISPTLIVPNLPQIASVAIPIIELNENIFFHAFNIAVWLFFGFLYPLPANLLCYYLMAGVGLLKLYSTDGGGSNSLRLNTVIGRDALRTSMFVFGNEMKYGTGRWGDSSTGIALLGLHVVTLLAHYVPPLVKPEKKKKMMINEIEEILTEVASEKKKEKVVNVDHVDEAPILGSGTKSFLEIV